MRSSLDTVGETYGELDGGPSAECSPSTIEP
jgi:hypothetical protein